MKPIKQIIALLSLAALLAAGAPHAGAQEPAPGEVIRQDVKERHMVAVEALVVEVNEERTRDLGIKYGFNKLNLKTVTNPDGTLSQIVENGTGVLDGGDVQLGRALTPVRVPVLLKNLEGRTDTAFEPNRMPGLGITLSGMNVGAGVVSAQLRTLLETGDAAIRTRPIAVALHNTRALIEVADEVPYLDINERNQVSVAFEPVGVRMSVIPVIQSLRPGVVALTIENLEVSSVSSFITQQNVQRPVFNKSQTSTQVTLSEGETFVIGGLKTQRVSGYEDRVPVLGSIPLLGWFFRSREDRERMMDVLFFVTPYILSPGENFLMPFDFKNQRALGIEIGQSR